MCGLDELVVFLEWDQFGIIEYVGGWSSLGYDPVINAMWHL